jgi:rhomboid protease GluP
MKKSFPYVSVLISLVTLFVSSGLAYYLHGTAWSTVNLTELRTYGGFDFQKLSQGEVWRLLTAQFVHVKQFHMVFNVICLLLLGISIEPIVGKIKTLLLWFVAGALGIMASVYFSTYSEEVGTGASQSIMGFLAANIIIMYRGLKHPSWLKTVVIVISFVALFLDFYSIHYPKPGHIVGFLCGLLLAYFFIPRKTEPEITRNHT